MKIEVSLVDIISQYVADIKLKLPKSDFKGFEIIRFDENGKEIKADFLKGKTIVKIE